MLAKMPPAYTFVPSGDAVTACTVLSTLGLKVGVGHAGRRGHHGEAGADAPAMVPNDPPTKRRLQACEHVRVEARWRRRRRRPHRCSGSPRRGAAGRRPRSVVKEPPTNRRVPSVSSSARPRWCRRRSRCGSRRWRDRTRPGSHRPPSRSPWLRTCVKLPPAYTVLPTIAVAYTGPLVLQPTAGTSEVATGTAPAGSAVATSARLATSAPSSPGRRRARARRGGACGHHVPPRRPREVRESTQKG